MNLSPALPTFVITLREGVEAALVVGIVLAYLKKADRTALNRWVWMGIAAGIIASVLVGIGFSSVVFALEAANQDYAPVVKQLLEGTFCGGAIVLLSWMLVWMTRQAKSLKAEVEGAIASALEQSDTAGWGVFWLIAIAVLREGFETVLFISAQLQQGWIPVIGAIAGLIGATAIGFLLFQLGVKINLRLFFQAMGVLLLLIVSGLVITALRKFDMAASLLAHISSDYAFLCSSSNGSCLLGSQVWDLSQTLPDRQFPGVLLKAFFGYTQKLYWGQAIAYLVFLLTIGSIYLQSITGWTLPSRQTAPVD